MGIFALQGIRKVHISTACCESLGVEMLDVRQMLLEGGFDVPRQHSGTIFQTFAVAHHDLMEGFHAHAKAQSRD